MAKQSEDTVELAQQLAEAAALIETLQSATADAEARAATVQAELVEVREAYAAARTELADAEQTRAELTETQSRLREAARYRAAKLDGAPEVPKDLVRAVESLDEIDAEFEAAQRVVSQLREKMQEERQSSRIPVGSPLRRAPDFSGLSATEKIRLGIEERDRH
jgi:DNA repair ATPase RecN